MTRRLGRLQISALPSLILLLAQLAPAPAGAQVLQGFVLEVESEAPVGEALVLLMRPDSTEAARSITNQAGIFELRAPAPGEYFLIATALGYARAVTERLELQPPGRRLKLHVTPQPIGLDPVVGEGVRRRMHDRNQGFYDRMQRRTPGRFITREQIERRQPVFAVDLLRNVPGLRVAVVRGQAHIEASQPTSYQTFISGRPCYANLYIDGAAVAPAAINAISPGDIEGIEVYSNTGAIPAEFNSSMGAACGVVVIWTRAGFDDELSDH